MRSARQQASEVAHRPKADSVASAELLRDHRCEMWFRVVVFLGVAACGDSPAASLLGEGQGGSGTTEGSAADDDSATDGNATSIDDACLEAGGHFGILWSRSVGGQFDLQHLRRLSPGLVASADGLWISLVNADGDVRVRQGYSAQASLDGALSQPATLVDSEWLGGRRWPGESSVLVTYCQDRIPRWLFVDPIGQALTPVMTPAGEPACISDPGATWTSPDDVLITWVETGPDCKLASSPCARVASASTDGIGDVYELFDAGDYGFGPSTAIAAGPESGLVVMVRRDQPSDPVQLVTHRVTLSGEPLAEATFRELPPSPAPEDLVFFDARPIPDEGTGFFVYVGGWGYSMGRVHLGARGQIIEALTQLPLITEIIVYGVYDSTLDGVFPRPGGFVAVGGAAQGGSVHTLLTALDVHGDPRGHVVLPNTAVTGTDGERLWALSLSNGIVLHELGCVVP